MISEDNTNLSDNLRMLMSRHSNKGSALAQPLKCQASSEVFYSDLSVAIIWNDDRRKNVKREQFSADIHSLLGVCNTLQGYVSLTARKPKSESVYCN